MRDGSLNISHTDLFCPVYVKTRVSVYDLTLCCFLLCRYELIPVIQFTVFLLGESDNCILIIYRPAGIACDRAVQLFYSFLVCRSFREILFCLFYIIDAPALKIQ